MSRVRWYSEMERAQNVRDVDLSKIVVGKVGR